MANEFLVYFTYRHLHILCRYRRALSRKEAVTIMCALRNVFVV